MNGCRPEGIFTNPIERVEIGPDLFRTACRMGLEGLMSKRRDTRSIHQHLAPTPGQDADRFLREEFTEGFHREANASNVIAASSML